MATSFIQPEYAYIETAIANIDLGVELVKGYYSKHGPFEGRNFDSFGGGGLSEPDRFTCEDLVACALLRTPIGPEGVTKLIITCADDFSELLKKLEHSPSFIDTPQSKWASKNYPGKDLYRKLIGIRGIGPTRATKLMARKRPDLFPISDSKVRAATVGKSRHFWAPLHQWLEEDDRRRFKQLEAIRERANPDISTLRVFDVIAWRIASDPERFKSR